MAILRPQRDAIRSLFDHNSETTLFAMAWKKPWEPSSKTMKFLLGECGLSQKTLHFLGLSRPSDNDPFQRTVAIFGFNQPPKKPRGRKNPSLEDWLEMPKSAGAVLLSDAPEDKNTPQCSREQIELLEKIPWKGPSVSTKMNKSFQRTGRIESYPVLVTS